MELTDKDLHCVSRLLQSSIFAESIFYGCNYCKYKNDCFDEAEPKEEMYIDMLRQKLQDITGIDLDPCYNCNDLEQKFKNYQS